jgi:hypothetical protein
MISHAKPEVRIPATGLLITYFFPPLHHPNANPLMPGQWIIRLESFLSRHKYRPFYFRRCASTLVRPPPSDDLGPTREDAHQTWRIWGDGTRKELPLPPSLDPVILKKRSRWTNTKAQPKPAEFTPFQKKLQANIYGT